MKTVKELETMLEEVRKVLEELKKNKNSFEPTPKGWKLKMEKNIGQQILI